MLLLLVIYSLLFVRGSANALKRWSFSPCAQHGEYCQIPADEYSGAIKSYYNLSGNYSFYTVPNKQHRLLVAYGAAGYYVYKEFGINMNVLYCHSSVFGDPGYGNSEEISTCRYKYIYNPKPNISRQLINSSTGYYIIPAGAIYLMGYTGEDMIAYVMGKVPLAPYVFGGESYTYHNGQLTHWEQSERYYTVYTEDLAHLYGEWDFCANEGYYCELPSNDTVYSIMFGTGSYYNGIIYSNVIKEFSGNRILCSTINFPAMPVDVSNFPGNKRFCKFTTKTIFSNILGYWELVASCENCIIEETLELGVTSSTSLATSQSWSKAFQTSIQRQLEFKLGESIRTVSNSSASMISQMSQHAFSQSLIRSCTAKCIRGNSLYQWVISANEACGLYESCYFNTYTCNYQCMKAFQEPVCPLGECADKDCISCTNNL